MGVFSSRDLFSPKFTTAIISDANNRWFPIPIKYVLGDFFIAEIGEEKETYVFKLEPTREKTYRAKGIRSVKILMYDLNHYMPISPENNTLLENFLRDNKLHKVNRTMLNALSYIGKRESHKKFEPVNIKEFFDVVATEQAEYKQEAKNFQTFFENLGVKEIVTPTKKISEFLIEDLITSHPQAYGMVAKAYHAAKLKHSRVTNEPKSGKTNWMVIIMIISLVGLGAGGILYLNSTGAFSHLIPQLPGSLSPNAPPGGTAKLSMEQIGKEYPTPKSLVDAIQARQVSCAQLQTDAIKMVNDPSGGGVAGTCP